MSDERARLLQLLSKTISDYRVGEVVSMTSDHIENWLSQFESKDQPVILQEMNFIMEKLYVSRQCAKLCVHEFLKWLIGSKKPEVVLSHIHFLHTNQSGNSQKEMLNLVDEILLENYGLNIASIDTHDIQNYIYMDDAIYTGNKMYHSLKESFEFLRHNNKLEKLIVYAIAIHTSGYKYAIQRIKNTYSKLDVKLYASSEIEDTRFSRSNIGILWPELTTEHSLINMYTANMYALDGQKLENNKIFRPSGYILQEKLFSSSQARRTVERAFLVKGIELIQGNQSQARSIRPLGFMKLTSLGFGTLFVTYRNIANNCPLVLWWGDPRYPVTHPFSKWYPLFPRQTNQW
ncbi:MAG: hypothetical protein ABI234_06320 [Ktedonobacteraceae bacterium]